MFGAPAVTVEQMIEWTAHWIMSEGPHAQQAHTFRKPGRKILVTQHLSVGFLGLSHLHPRSYMPLFQAIPGATVVAAADSNPIVLEGFTQSFPVRGYADWRDLLEREQLDLAVIFLPHADCPEAAVACAQRGVHVLVEKPMAASAEGVRRMIAAAEQAGVILSTPYVWRYHPVALEMKKLIERA